jgi:hypothetical protein
MPRGRRVSTLARNGIRAIAGSYFFAMTGGAGRRGPRSFSFAMARARARCQDRRRPIGRTGEARCAADAGVERARSPGQGPRQPPWLLGGYLGEYSSSPPAEATDAPQRRARVFEIGRSQRTIALRATFVAAVSARRGRALALAILHMDFRCRAERSGYVHQDAGLADRH